jgi:hypothetical protein
MVGTILFFFFTLAPNLAAITVGVVCIVIIILRGEPLEPLVNIGNEIEVAGSQCLEAKKHVAG